MATHCKMQSDLDSNLFLGFDASTQGLKVTAISGRDCSVVTSLAINFDSDLPQYGTKGGMIHGPGDGVVTAPPLMWVEAFDLVLQRLKERSFPFNRVVAVSGSGQQHGSVFWRDGADILLENLDPTKTLAVQLSDAFAREQSPIWADSSTAAHST